MLEGVTLAQMVEFMIEMFVDLAGSAVFDEQTAEDTEATHPHDLTRRRDINLASFECYRLISTL